MYRRISSNNNLSAVYEGTRVINAITDKTEPDAGIATGCITGVDSNLRDNENAKGGEAGHINHQTVTQVFA